MTGAMATPRATVWTGAPSFADVLAARDFLASYLSPTPLIRRDAVSGALGLDVWLKCENLLPTAARPPVTTASRSRTRAECSVFP